MPSSYQPLRCIDCGARANPEKGVFPRGDGAFGPACDRCRPRIIAAADAPRSSYGYGLTPGFYLRVNGVVVPTFDRHPEAGSLEADELEAGGDVRKAMLARLDRIERETAQPPPSSSTRLSTPAMHDILTLAGAVLKLSKDYPVHAISVKWAMSDLNGWTEKTVERRIRAYLQSRQLPSGRGQWRTFVTLVINEPERFTAT